MKKGTKWSIVGGTIAGIISGVVIKFIGDVAYNDGIINGYNGVANDINNDPERFKDIIDKIIKQKED